MLANFCCPDCQEESMHIVVCEAECLYTCTSCESEFSQEDLTARAEQLFKAAQMLHKTFLISKAIDDAEISVSMTVGV